MIKSWYVDENNTIVLTGALADGTYNIKYEMDDGSTVDIGDLVLDSTVYYAITSTLTNCTNSNSAKSIAEGESYSATIMWMMQEKWSKIPTRASASLWMSTMIVSSCVAGILFVAFPHRMAHSRSPHKEQAYGRSLCVLRRDHPRGENGLSAV